METLLNANDIYIITITNIQKFMVRKSKNRKWLHEHIATIILCVVVWISIMIWAAQKSKDSNSCVLLGAIGSVLALLFYVVLYNRMMVYVENHAYRATTDNKKNNI